MSSDFESPLLFDTPSAWVDAVLADFDSFLLDHAAAEKKASVEKKAAEQKPKK